jgi:hypothetical protein
LPLQNNQPSVRASQRLSGTDHRTEPAECRAPPEKQIQAQTLVPILFKSPEISAAEPRKEAQINGGILFWQGKFLSGNVLGAERVKCVNEHKGSHGFMFTL